MRRSRDAGLPPERFALSDFHRLSFDGISAAYDADGQLHCGVRADEALHSSRRECVTAGRVLYTCVAVRDRKGSLRAHLFPLI